MRKTMISTVTAIVLTSMVGFANGPVGKKGNNSDEVVKNILNVDLDPTFKRIGNKLFVNLLNLDQEKVIIKVYDSQKRIVFKEVMKGNLVIEKAFNFEDAFEDEYTVVIVDNNEKFEEKIAVE